MLAEALTVLAAAAGTAVVQAAGTSTWQAFQQAAARWLGRGDEERERAELERMDRSATVLAATAESDAELVGVRQQAAWQARFENVLESLTDEEQEQAAHALRTLLDAHASTGRVSAGAEGQAVGGNVNIRADRGSVAAQRMGNVTVGTPSLPGPSQG